MAERVPAEVFPPGEFVKDELEARGLSQADLAAILGRPERLVSEIVTGKRSVTPETARGLADAFGTDPQFWMNLESAYQLSRVKRNDDTVARRAKLYALAPIRDMVRRHWIEPSENIDVMEHQVASFFGVGAVNDVDDMQLAYAAKKTSYVEDTTPVQYAWICRVRQVAKRLVVPPYSEARLLDALPKLRSMMMTPDQAGGVPKVLADCGVRFVLVENLAGAKIDGVCFWIDAATPVIGMTVRHDRIDNFWFVLRHEIEHVLRKHGASVVRVDVDLGEGEHADLPEDERQANAAASDFAVTDAKMSSWIARKSPFFSELDVLGFAKTQGVHPGIVAGQLRHRTKNYRLFAKLLEKVRFALLPTAVVDGWGETYPIT
jgi:HTH-type transcriptional regulator/antitoxin HigA